MRQIVLDTETTGLYADQGDRIVEIGCVELENRKLTGRHLHYYVNPERDSHEEALKVHGIANEFLKISLSLSKSHKTYWTSFQAQSSLFTTRPLMWGF